MKFHEVQRVDIDNTFNLKEVETLSHRISEKLTFRCNRHDPVKTISRGTRACNGLHTLLPVKCSRCFSRNCSCTNEEKQTYQAKIMDSSKTLEKLLREQTLIQEAVRRLQFKSLLTSKSRDHYKSEDGNSECLSHYTSYDSDSDLD